MNENLSLALQLALILAEQAQKYTQMVQTAVSENRDVTEDELNQASADYKTAHDQLDALLKG